MPQQPCFKRLGALHEQALPQPSLDCLLHKDDGGPWRSAVSDINIFKFFFLPVTPYFFCIWFFYRFLIDCIIQKNSAQNYKHFHHQSLLLNSYCVYCRDKYCIIVSWLFQNEWYFIHILWWRIRWNKDW